MPLYKSILFSCALSLSTMSGAFQQAAAQMSLSSTPVRVCVEDWGPYIEQDQNGLMQGPVAEFLRTTAAKAGSTVQFKRASFRRCVQGAQSGLHDIVVLTSPGTPGLNLSEVVLAEWVLSAFVAEGAPHQIYEKMEQFSGERVGLFAGYIYPDSIARHEPTWSAAVRMPFTGQIAPGEVRMFRMLERGRVDVAFADRAWALSVGATEHHKVRMLSPAVCMEPNMLGYSPSAPEVQALYEKALLSAVRSGALAALYRKYNVEPPTFLPPMETADTAPEGVGASKKAAK